MMSHVRSIAHAWNGACTVVMGLMPIRAGSKAVREVHCPIPSWYPLHVVRTMGAMHWGMRVVHALSVCHRVAKTCEGSIIWWMVVLVSNIEDVRCKLQVKAETIRAF